VLKVSNMICWNIKKIHYIIVYIISMSYIIVTSRRQERRMTSDK
jgi:hypothetical protein